MAPVAAKDGLPRIYRLIAGVSRPVVSGLYRLRVEGLEHLPAEGGFVIAANHVSNFDPWPLGMAVYPRQLHFMAKAELYNPLFKLLFDAVGAFPVRRGEADVESFRTAVRLARAGGAVVMFPEGTRRTKGLLKRRRPEAHPGAARIALTARVPLVPAAIAGTDRLTRLGPLGVRFGPPVEVHSGAARRQAAREATVELMERIEELAVPSAGTRVTP
jgi:1-acyl-sn-glycerol-3-phosphate acyltransferase